jgi:lipopolysaccharide/colanic/teichoic acid biosynthesis glycosyltransferase
MEFPIWQVSGRNDIIVFDEWARMDLEYIDSWSLGLDLRLILKTFPAVFRGNGAS